MNWKYLLPNLSTAQTLARAQSALGHHTKYQLGAGGINPLEPFPAACDCSGFVAWSIGIPRELPPGSAHWIYTDGIWSGGLPLKAGLFIETSIADATAGDLLVYPHNLEGEHGHVGIILKTANNLPSKVVHCSLGNDRHFGDAVRITGPSVFLSGNHPTRAMKINYALLKEFI